MYLLGSRSAWRLYATAQNYYQILRISLHASLKEIKALFRRLLKEFHPDLNTHLDSKGKEANHQKYTDMVQAYDTLKDVRRRQEYDTKIGQRGHRVSSGSFFKRLNEKRGRGFSSHRTHSRNGSNYTSSRYTTRYKVYDFHSGERPTMELNFSGRHKDHSNRYDVPHFDYNEHLAKNLKFEQHIIKRDFTEKELEQVLRPLAQNGQISKISDELLTKYLMNRRRSYQVRAKYKPMTEHRYAGYQHMYKKPEGCQNTSDGLFKTFTLLGGVGSAYLFYKCFF